MKVLLSMVLALAGLPKAAHGEAAKDSGVPYRTVVLMPLSSLGSTDEAVGAIQRVLVGEFQKVLGKRLVTPQQVTGLGPEVRAGLETCGGVVECINEVMGGMGYDAFVVGNVAGLGEDRVINLKLIDIRTGSEVRRTAERAFGDESQLISYMRKAAVQLVAPHLFTGAVEIVAKQTGVQITLNGEWVGSTPLTTSRLEVPAGRHALEATAEGYVPFSSMVNVAYGETKQVTIELPLSTAFVGGSTPFRHRWYTWAIAGAGVLGLGLGGYFNYLHVDAVNKINDRADKGTLTAANVDLYQQQEDNWNRALYFYGGGGALALTAAVMLSMDLF
ncbi:MAG: PEGA domain-containing protein [Deltaproteobacteria bacterium]|nr:PEGA domain-containing protein [Deltaproteobacteria bacterium]